MKYKHFKQALLFKVGSSLIFAPEDKRSVTQETEEAEKQCIAFVSRILQKRLKRSGTTLSLTG